MSDRLWCRSAYLKGLESNLNCTLTINISSLLQLSHFCILMPMGQLFGLPEDTKKFSSFPHLLAPASTKSCMFEGRKLTYKMVRNTMDYHQAYLHLHPPTHSRTLNLLEQGIVLFPTKASLWYSSLISRCHHDTVIPLRRLDGKI